MGIPIPVIFTPDLEVELIYIVPSIYIFYSIGYCFQEIAGVFHFTITNYRKPPKLVRLLTNWFTGIQIDELKEMPKMTNVENLYFCRDRHISKKHKKRLSRLVNLMQVGSCMGPAFCLSSAFYFLNCNRIGYFLGTISLVIGLGLVITNRIKNIQFYRYLIFLNGRCKTCRGNFIVD